MSRIMFAIAKVPFVDFRYPVINGEETPEFDADRDAGKLTINMDRLPILLYNGPEGESEIGQSKAIERFLAKKLGFYGSNELEGALIDMIMEHVRDIKQKYNDAKKGKKDAELSAAKVAFITTDLPAWFAKLEKTLSGSDGFAIGNKLSLADISIHHIVSDYMDDLEAVAAAAQNCPRIVSAVKKVATAGQEWFASRPVSSW